MNSSVRNLVLWVVVLGLVGLVFAVIKNTKPTGAHPDFSVLVRDVKDGKVEKITLNSVTGDVHGKYKNGDEFTSTVPHTYNDFTTLLIDKGVAVNVEKDAGGNWVSLLMNAIPFVLLVGFWVFMMRQMQSGGNKALSFGKSRARLHSSQQKKVTFKDVAGCRGSQGRIAGDHRVSARAAEVPEAGRTHPQGRAADRLAGHRQDAAGARHRGRSQCAVLLDLRFGFRRDVCGRRRQPRARSVRARQEERALHHLHR